MFSITGYSLCTALIVSNLFFILFILLANSKKILLQSSLIPFKVIGILILVRMFVPLENGHTEVIPSYDVFPVILNVLQRPLFDIGDYHVKLGILLMLIWITVSVLLLIHKFKSYRTFVIGCSGGTMRCDKKMADILEEVKAANGYHFPTTLIVDKCFDSIMEFGFFKQTILLPDVSYSEKELRYILHHELEHFANKTNWIKLLITIIEVLFWWNPLVYVFRNACSHLLEIYCDYSISKDFKQWEKLEYLECLLQEAKREYSIRAQGAKRDVFYINNFAFGSHLKQRFEVLLDRKRNYMFEIVLGIVMLIGFFYSYSFVIQPGYAPPAVNLSDFTQQEYDIRYQNGKYFVYVGDEVLVEYETKEAMEKSGFVSKEDFK